MKKETIGQTVCEQLKEIADFKMLEEIISEGLTKEELAIKIYKLWWTRRTLVNCIPGILGALLLILILK